MAKNYYEILGISENDKNLPFDKFKDILKKKYRDSSKKYHPDLQRGKSESERKAAEEKFKEINEAYSVLSDPKKKQEYDQFGSIGGMNMGAGGFSDMADFIRNMHASGGFNPFNDNFNPFGGGFSHKQEMPGADVSIKVDCTIEDIYNGVTKNVKYTRHVKCSDCGGSGSKDGGNTSCPYCNGTGVITEKSVDGFTTFINQTVCPHCHGSGKIVKNPCRKCKGTGLEETKETVSIPIPKTIRHGDKAKMDGMGDMAPNNGTRPGNLIIHFNVLPHSSFEIAPNQIDLICKVKVNVLDCVTGCDKTVDCINGKTINVHIPFGSRNGQTVTVKGNGMPSGNGRYGDMIVVIDQVMPDSLSKDELKTINELKTSKNFK